MEEEHKFCSWHCPCTVLLSKNPVFTPNNVFDLPPRNQPGAGDSRRSQIISVEESCEPLGQMDVDSSKISNISTLDKPKVIAVATSIDSGTVEGNETLVENEVQMVRGTEDAFTEKTEKRSKRPPRRFLPQSTRKKVGVSFTKTGPLQGNNVNDTTTASDREVKSRMNGCDNGLKSSSNLKHIITVDMDINQPISEPATVGGISRITLPITPAESSNATPKFTKKPAPPSSAPSALSSYSARVRNRSSFHKCGNCGKMFGQLASLKWHEKEHLLETSKHCECVECGKSYTSIGSYQRHLKTHTKCLLCGKTIPKTGRDSKFDGNGLAVNVCRKCRNSDVSKTTYNSSPKTGNGISKSDSATAVVSNLTVNGNHTNGLGVQTEEKAEEQKEVSIKSYKCDVCGKVFGILGNLKIHYNLHTQNHPSYPCKYCGRIFPSLKKLTNHESVIHTVERPYKCPHCSARFKAPHHRIRHELMHTGEKPFECKHCGQAFNQRFRLKNHLARVHNELADFSSSSASPVSS